MKICTDLHRDVHKIVFVIVWHLKLFRNNNKNNFALTHKHTHSQTHTSVQKLKQYDVKWWLNYRKYGSVSYSFSCTQTFVFCSKSGLLLHDNSAELCTVYHLLFLQILAYQNRGLLGSKTNR
jgi:hypothetical protein